MTLDELRARQQGGVETLWWTFRFLRAVVDCHDKAPEADKATAVGCFLKLAVADPDWVMAAVGAPSPEGHFLAMLLRGDRLDAALSRLQLPTVKDDAMLRARMLAASASWALKGGVDDIWRKAWEQLQRVPAEERDADWKAVALGPAAVADYPAYRQLAVEHLASLRQDFYRHSFLPGAMAVAARNKDWPAFEAWLAAWRSLPESLCRGHEECAVINLEGLRALDEGRLSDAEAAMKRLLVEAPTTQFLSNPDVSALPKRLRAEGRLLKLCDAFDAIVKRVDWRLVTRDS